MAKVRPLELVLCGGGGGEVKNQANLSNVKLKLRLSLVIEMYLVIFLISTTLIDYQGYPVVQ